MSPELQEALERLLQQGKKIESIQKDLMSRLGKPIPESEAKPIERLLAEYKIALKEQDVLFDKVKLIAESPEPTKWGEIF